MMLAIDKESDEAIGVFLKDLFAFREETTLANGIVIKLNRF